MADDEKRVTPDSRYEVFSKRVGWTLAALVVWSLVIGGLQLHLIHRDGDRQKAIALQQMDIQQQRRDSIRTSCEQQNLRNETTVTRLRKLSAAAPRRDRSTADIKRGLDGTIQLIDALVPVQDCEELVKEKVR